MATGRASLLAAQAARASAEYRDVSSVHTPSLAANRAILERFETVAERFEADGAVEDAIAAVELGAVVAGARHPGIHVSHRFERLIERIAADLLERLTARAAHGTVERVLHVATETYQVGGHSRMIWRWIERDAGRAHTVVTTRQRAAAAAGVARAAEASGGRFVELDHEAPALERARAVRELAAEADVVVLHAHPNDPVPVLAFAAAGARPPVVFFNHCDHLFWLGASVVDTLYSLRPAGARLGLRRGIAAERNLQGPAPVMGDDGNGPSADADPALRSRARAAVLRQLGGPSNTVLLLSVGASYKFDEGLSETLLELAGPVVAANPRARLLAIGPNDEGRWHEASQSTRGRIRALGPRTGLSPVFAAADIYLESRPGGGTGASSEAAAHGLPVLTHAPGAESAELHTTDAGYGATLELGADAYRGRLQGLIESRELRAELGRQARATVEAADAAWQGAVEGAYALAAELGPASASDLAPPAFAPDVFDELIARDSATRQPMDDAVAEGLAAAAELAQRCAAVRSLYGPRLNIGAGPQNVIAAVFCAPSADPVELRTAIAEFRLLAAARVSARFVLAMTPEDADPAIPVLEEALADGPQIPVDLVIDVAPETARPDGAMELVLGEPAGLEPHQYACPLPAVAV
jgi:glycosyltransferase involved in cell wall biosynthesis